MGGNTKWDCYGDEQDGGDDDYSWEDGYYCDTDPACVCDPVNEFVDTEGNTKWDCYGSDDADDQDGGDDGQDWDTDYGEQTWECSAENDCQTVDGDYFMMCCADPYGDNTEVAECDAENDCQTIDGDYFMGCCAEGGDGDIDYEEDDYDWEDEEYDYGDDEYYCDADAGCVCGPSEWGLDTEGNEKWNCYGDEQDGGFDDYDDYYRDADAGRVCDPEIWGQDTEGNEKWDCYGDEGEYDFDSDEWWY